MSYDIRLKDRVTGEVLELDSPHFLTGGTYRLGGTTECWLNITYNYADIYYKHFGEKGIRAIYGMSGAESIPLLKSVISELSGEVWQDDWGATEANAKRALCKLLALGEMRPDEG